LKFCDALLIKSKQISEKMTGGAAQTSEGKFSFSSSVAADVWHPKKNPEAFEWWYFDALSDDGRDAVVIIFLDNFIFSPRYNSENRKPGSFRNRFRRKREAQYRKCYPAIAFTYYRDGKPQYRAINEFAPEEFFSDEKKPACRIGNNFFHLDSAPYGSGYVLSINLKLRKNRNLKANFEWLSIESDLLPEKPFNEQEAHNWNLAVARADVSGRITVTDRGDKIEDVVHFRGTGYHDHNLDNRWLPETVSEWQWGRAHFSDATAVFYRYKEYGEAEATSKIFTVCDNKLIDRNAAYKEQNWQRDVFGIKYPTQLDFNTKDNLHLSVKQTDLIDKSFFYLRFISEMTLTLPDGKPHTAIGMTELLNPKALKYYWLDWLTNMRIGRNGKGSFLP
jgi:carotenoid 1,2-hydratase